MTSVTVDAGRLAEVLGRGLGAGAHTDWQAGACVMEAAAYVAGEPWTDRPACVSPPLAAFLRAWNDALDDEPRQRLRPYVKRVVGTAGDAAADERRSWLACDWLIRVQIPAWMVLTEGLREHAEVLAALPPQTSLAALERSVAARDAARVAAGNALAPTRDRLIESAFVLLDRMIDAGPEDRPWEVA